MATKRDVIEFKEFVETVEEEFDEFFTDKMADIEIYLDERGFGEYDIIYETFDKIENSKEHILLNLKRMKTLLAKILAKQ